MLIPSKKIGQLKRYLDRAAQIVAEEGLLAFLHQAFYYLARHTPVGRSFLYQKSIAELRDRMQRERSTSDMLDTVLSVRPGYPPYRLAATQLREELEELLDVLHSAQPRTVLEIGTARGGSLYLWCRALPTVRTVISVDMPDGRFGGGYVERKKQLYRTFSENTDLHLIRADSQSEATYRKVLSCLGEMGAVDFLFIDGDHTYEGVKNDFERYSPLVDSGGIIALHDIAYHPATQQVVHDRRLEGSDMEPRHLRWSQDHPDCNVHRLWTQITQQPSFDTNEFLSHPRQTWAGIGVIFVR